jgi:hypothetical protein
MIRRTVGLMALVLICSFSYAQKKQKVARPDIPGSFMIDFGFNQGIKKVNNFSQKFLGSHTVNLYYQYPIRFGRSRFSVNPGIGFSFERFKMKNYYTLKESTSTKGQFDLVSTATIYPTASSIKKSLLINNYFEIPVDFRFDTKPEDISRSFNVAIGGRFGYLYDAMTKVKYKQEGEMKIMKDKQNHGMNRIRYGAYMRVGIGAVNLFGFYNLSPLFEKNKGPEKTTMNSFTMGISVNGF